MALGKQAKTLTKKQIELVLLHLGRGRNVLRNQVIFLLSVRAGLRAKEIANLRWEMVTDSLGDIADEIHLNDNASKGRSGRRIPINKHLKEALGKYFDKMNDDAYIISAADYVLRTERSVKTSSQVVVNMFAKWYSEMGFIGCSSHSGRRTFITGAARKISLVGGSLRDVQALAGHSSLQVTQRYIDYDSEAQKKVIELI